MLPLSELLAEFDLQLKTAAEHSDQDVRWVHISELVDPVPWLSGSELLLTTGLQLETEKIQREFVQRLARNGTAALGFGVGFAHQQVPAALVDEAEKAGLPVFEVPYELPFIALTNRAATEIINHKYVVLQQAIDVHQKLEQVVLSEQGLVGIAKSLAPSIGGTVLVLDCLGEILATAGKRAPTKDLLQALKAKVDERFTNNSGEEIQLTVGRLELVAKPTSSRQVIEGRDSSSPKAWLVLVKERSMIDDFDHLVLYQAAALVALELLRKRVAADTAQRLAGSILAEAIAGELVDEDLVRRLEPFGLVGQVAALSLMVDEAQATPEVLRGLEKLVFTELTRTETKSLVANLGKRVSALVGVQAGGEEKLFEVAADLKRRAEVELGLDVGVGVGRAVSIDAVRRTCQEAEWALETRVLNRDENAQMPIASYKDLGSLQLILGVHDQSTLKLFCNSVLAPIENGEGQYGDELLKSLQVFVEENGQWEKAANRLYCHRHTLRYRIRKIEELTGRDLSSASDRIEFWLALKARQIVTK